MTVSATSRIVDGMVALPGGSFRMGLSEEDVEDASEFVDWTAGVAEWVDAMCERAVA